MAKRTIGASDMAQFTKTEIDPKTSQITFYVPGGYIYEEDDGAGGKRTHVLNKVTMREMTGHEEDILADDRMSVTQRMHAMISNCITMLSNDSGVSLSQDKLPKPCTNHLLMSDILVSLFRIREVTVGDEMRIKAECSKCKDDDGNPFAQTHIFSIKNIDVVPVTGDPKMRVREFMTKSGKKITWEMMNGDMELQNEAMRSTEKKTKDKDGKKIDRASNKATYALISRVRTIDDLPATVDSLKGLPFRDRQEIRNRFDEEGGIDTDILVICRNCKASYEVSIGLAALDFFTRSEA